MTSRRYVLVFLVLGLAVVANGLRPRRFDVASGPCASSIGTPPPAPLRAGTLAQDKNKKSEERSS